MALGNGGMGVGGGNGGGGFPIGEVKPENTTIVNSLSDLPEPSDLGDGNGLKYRIGKDWVIGADITIPYGFAPKNNTEILNIDLKNNQIIFTGTGALFKSNPTNSWTVFEIRNCRLVGNSNAEVFDFEGINTSDFYSENVRASNFGMIASIMKQKYALLVQNYFTDFGVSGLILDNNLGFLISICSFQTGIAINDTYITISGNLVNSTGRISNVLVIPITGDSGIYIDPNYTGFLDIFGADIILEYGGEALKTGSLTHETIGIKTFASKNIPDSKIYGSFSWNDNSTETVITYDANDYNIILFSDAGGGEVEVSTSVAHSIVNGQSVWIIGSSYDGEYVATNVGSTTFQIIAVFNPAALNQGSVTVGWEKVLGTTYPMENERISHIADNQLVFNNVEQAEENIGLNCSVLRGSGAGTPTFSVTYFKNSVPIYNVNNDLYISSVDVDNTTPRNLNLSIFSKLKKDDNISVCVRRKAGSGNFKLQNGTLIIN